MLDGCTRFCSGFGPIAAFDRRETPLRGGLLLALLAQISPTGFETNQDKRSKDEDKIDWFFELLGRDVKGYKS